VRDRFPRTFLIHPPRWHLDLAGQTVLAEAERLQELLEQDLARMDVL
jgi:hypothetical protein